MTFETHCGHDPTQFVTADEGTSYCPACEAAARVPVRGRKIETEGLAHGSIWVGPDDFVFCRVDVASERGDRGSVGLTESETWNLIANLREIVGDHPDEP